MAKLIKVSSKIINHNPRLNKKFLLVTMFAFLLNESQAETPDRKTNVGAHKWVIQRVKKRNGVVVARSVGLWVIEFTCIRSRVWSSAIMIIASPLVISILWILFILYMLLNYFVNNVIPALNITCLSTKNIIVRWSKRYGAVSYVSYQTNQNKIHNTKTNFCKIFVVFAKSSLKKGISNKKNFLYFRYKNHRNEM